MVYVIFMIFSFSSSLIGAICGIGGGVILKPGLDAIGLYDTVTVNFLSGCTVLAMTTYSLLHRLCKRSGTATGKKELITLSEIGLSFGAATGGIAGKSLFHFCVERIGKASFMTSLQSLLLFFLVLLVFLYERYFPIVRKKTVHALYQHLLIGFDLGLISSFLGIGGGPINLLVLKYFYGMEVKQAVKSSLFIVFLSQLFSFIYTFMTGVFPTVSVQLVLLMIFGGITGGIAGRGINTKISGETVTKLFSVCNLVIMGICIFNIIR